MPRREAPVGPASRVLGENLRAARVAAGISQGDLAERLGGNDAGWSQAIVTNLETARTHCRVEQLLELAQALDVDACDLLPEPS